MSAGGDRYEAARRAFKLPDLWEQYGHRVLMVGQRYQTAFTPCCGESQRPDAGSLFLRTDGSWRWHCFRCSRGGSAIDFVAAMEKIKPAEAVKKLLQDGGGFEAITGREPEARKPRVAPEERAAALRQVIGKMLDGLRGIPHQIRDYLETERGITEAVLREAVERDCVRFLPYNADAADLWLRLKCGDELLVKSGLLRSGNRRTAAAYRPIIFLPAKAGAAEFTVATRQRREGVPKALQYGDKVLPMTWTPKSGKVKSILIVEGGIDFLSVVSLGFDRDTLILGLMGVAAWKREWIETLCQKYPDAGWQIGFDADKGGESSAERIADAIQAAGGKATRLQPWGGGNDWNDALLAAREAF